MQRSIFNRSVIHSHTRESQLRKFLTSIAIQSDSDSRPCSTIEDHESLSSLQLQAALARGGCAADSALTAAIQAFNCGAKPNGYALVQLVRICTSLSFEFCAHQLHGYILRSGFAGNVFVGTSLINFYVKIEAFHDADKVFDEIPHPSVVSWNSLISGYVQNGQFRKALSLFIQLDGSENVEDSYSLSAALAASGQLSWLQLGESLHSKVVKLGLEDSVVVGNCLIDMYGKCGSLKVAHQVFTKMVEKDTISWNSIIGASARNGSLNLAFGYLHQMPRPDTISYNELINGCAQFGDIEDAVEILANMASPNSSSWNAVITGYVNRNEAWEALIFFNKMHSHGIQMDRFTFSSILNGISMLSALKWGSLIHCCTMKHGLNSSTVVGSALIDMYSKCGQVTDAESIFWSLPRKNLVSWNTMISGFAHNSKPIEVIRLFEQLKTTRDIKPDSITFLNVLFACSSNEVPMETTLQYFISMVEDYGIEPTIEHCCTMIRLMGQRGEVYKGKKMIYELGFGSNGLVWRALLGACGACREFKLAKIAAAKVIELGAVDDYVHVMMSNILASHGKWRDVREVREIMRKKGVRKEVGCSWMIEMENSSPY